MGLQGGEVPGGAGEGDGIPGGAGEGDEVPGGDDEGDGVPGGPGEGDGAGLARSFRTYKGHTHFVVPLARRFGVNIAVVGCVHCALRPAES